MVDWGQLLDLFEETENSRLRVPQEVLDSVNDFWSTQFSLKDCSNRVHGRELSRGVCYTFITEFLADPTEAEAIVFWESFVNPSGIIALASGKIVDSFDFIEQFGNIELPM